MTSPSCQALHGLNADEAPRWPPRPGPASSSLAGRHCCTKTAQCGAAVWEVRTSLAPLSLMNLRLVLGEDPALVPEQETRA